MQIHPSFNRRCNLKRGTKSANFVKIAQGIRVYIPRFSKMFSFGALYTYLCTDGDEIWHSSVPNFTPSVPRVTDSSLLGEKTSKLPPE